MPTFELDVSEATARGLAVEADLLGFETREAYLEWIVSRRFAIDGDDERAALLATYAERAEEMDLKNVETPPIDREVEADPPDPGDLATVMGTNLAPDVARVEDDTVADNADALSSVEANRFNEIARRAVAQTRERLGDGVGSGIDYSSQTAIDDDRRVGEDIADLDAIEVPGYDDELIERRRRAVGAALALLRDLESAKRSDFVDALYEEFPAGYDSESAWWECVKQGLEQVDRVKPARDGGHTWEYRSVPGRVKRISFDD
ncbi:Uncharacterized protein HSBGL_1178 [Halapricum desulfuricans]|uniref:Uncharacterized protein n=1 Tax=Halapricum desulfuricans TaxID=2841257 RepID=A0A897NFW4_9EURY|nr:hypothetical protein [Halapricum desulfuricans]QSG11602.1 Uncharacterized protein HSBGL_1178 [Halapricum desulfuricans]